MVFAGNITLSFTYPVDLSMLAKAMRVAGQGSAGREITVSPCPAVLQTPRPLVFSAAGAQDDAAAGESPEDLLQVNSTCAVVKIVPGLAAGTSVVLRLPAGSKYSSIAGPVVLDTDVRVSWVLCTVCCVLWYTAAHSCFGTLLKC